MERQNISSGTKWEAMGGYSRAVRLGNQVFVSGTTATDDNGQLVGGSDIHAQSVFIFQKIERALNSAGATLADVVRTRIFIVDESQWEGPVRAHAEFFETIRPANTLVVVKALIGPEYLVEIEADAVISE
ncbi:MAG: RidA family protein [Anaerolineae bacterium]|nr:RidA family protein [Anaerolineae bacterium]